MLAAKLIAVPQLWGTTGDIGQPSYLRNTSSLGETAHPGQIGLQQIDNPTLDEISKGEGGEVRLAAGNAHIRPGRERRHVTGVVNTGQWLFPPVDAGSRILDHAGSLNGLGKTCGATQIEHEIDVIAGPVAQLPEDGCVAPGQSSKAGPAVKFERLCTPDPHTP